MGPLVLEVRCLRWEKRAWGKGSEMWVHRRHGLGEGVPVEPRPEEAAAECIPRMMQALQRAPHLECKGASQVGRAPGLQPLSPGENASQGEAVSRALLAKGVLQLHIINFHAGGWQVAIHPAQELPPRDKRDCPDPLHWFLGTSTFCGVRTGDPKTRVPAAGVAVGLSPWASQLSRATGSQALHTHQTSQPPRPASDPSP